MRFTAPIHLAQWNEVRLTSRPDAQTKLPGTNRVSMEVIVTIVSNLGVSKSRGTPKMDGL